MYGNKITLFNRYHSKTGDFWYPKVIDKVDLVIDKASILSKYGVDSQDTAKLHIKYSLEESEMYVNGFKYYKPKEWEALTNDELVDAITFKDGQYFDFFMDGEWKDLNPIDDNDYKDGFYNYVNKNFDNVFAISSVSSPYTLIKHFEIMGK